jgi:uncharacterized protein YggE
MKNAKILLACGFLSLALSSFGQSPAEEQPYIEVTGSAELEVIPDEIYIGISIVEKYVNKVKITIEEQEAALMESIQKLGIDRDKLVLSDADASYVKVRWKTKDVITRKDYILKASDAATVGRVYQELEQLEIKDASISRVSYSKMDSLRREVKILALKAAKEKAAYLLAAIGEQMGKPMIIREQTLDGSFYNSEVNVQGSRKGTATYYIDGIRIGSEQSGEIQFEKIKTRSEIFCRFSIQ